MTRARELGRAIRREVEPAWDEVHERRVLRRIPVARALDRRVRWPIVALLAAAIAIAAISLWHGTAAEESEAKHGSLAPMGLVPPLRERVSEAAQERRVDRGGTANESDAGSTSSTRSVAPPASLPQTPARSSRERDASPSPPRAELHTRSAASLLEQADAARRGGALVEATALLRRFVDEHPRHPEIASARMGLARVLEQRGSFAEAARAYEALLGGSVIGTIREDARAGAARVWSRDGRSDRARAHAEAYLERNPNGPHARAMEAIAGP